MEGWHEGFLGALSDIGVGYSDHGEDTSHMYFTKHLAHPCDLPKSSQEVNERPTAHVKEEKTGSKQLRDFPCMA